MHEWKDVPLFNTACHSCSDLWSGYVISAEDDDELKSELKNGIAGIDLIAVPRTKGDNARCG